VNPERFGIESASALAMLAVANGIIRKRDRFDFACWLADTYRDEDDEYVRGLNLSTLHGRFLESRAA